MTKHELEVNGDTVRSHLQTSAKLLVALLLVTIVLITILLLVAFI